MNTFTFPIDDSIFFLRHVLAVDELAEQLNNDALNTDFLDAVLQESSKICGSLIAPLNPTGDTQGATLIEGQVRAATGFKDAYTQFAANGWTALTSSPDFGGQGLPYLLGMACNEILFAASISFSLAPMLTAGAIDAIHSHASDALKHQFLPKMISGEWTGTMNLTEPDAGSDLAAVKTKAIPEGDHYRISGQKIFISWGDHDLTDNIVHLVLARLPDAPPGVKGISLFLVPKYLVAEDGTLGARNAVTPIALEHKLGIHASPTCALSFGDQEGAVGYLIGEPHKGLPYMFTMMNRTRHKTGVQGLGVSERAYQLARDYAKERLQGTRSDGSRYNILHFPEVRRQLLLMRSGVEAMRALSLVSSLQYDQYAASNSPNDLKRLELFTPIVKAWMTELSQEITSTGIQVHGGMGYIEETGAAQLYRDARILAIYEGTTAIQGNDLIGRKILLDQGATINALLAEMASDLATTEADELLAMQCQMQAALAQTRSLVDWVLAHGTDRKIANAIGSNMAMLMGYLCGGWCLFNAAQAAARCRQAGNSDVSPAFCANKITTARFYADHYLPRIAALASVIQCGSNHLDDISEEDF